MYKPSFEILKKIINKKNQNTDKYKFLIVLRNHTCELKLIDQIISVLLSHFDNDIFIGISPSINLRKSLSDDFVNLCNYINVANGHNIHNRYTDISSLTHGIDYFRNINCEYVLYHTASEYYCKPIEKDFKVNYSEKENIHKDNNVIEKINNLPEKWWWGGFKKDNKGIEYFVKNNIVPVCKQINGAVIRKDIVLDFIDSLKGYPSVYKACMSEIMPISYLNKYFTYDKYSLCNCYWEKQNSVAILHKEKYTNDKVDYYTIKRIDGNNGLLNYLHQSYIVDRLKTLNIDIE